MFKKLKLIAKIIKIVNLVKDNEVTEGFKKWIGDAKVLCPKAKELIDEILEILGVKCE